MVKNRSHSDSDCVLGHRNHVALTNKRLQSMVEIQKCDPSLDYKKCFFFKLFLNTQIVVVGWVYFGVQNVCLLTFVLGVLQCFCFEGTWINIQNILKNVLRFHNFHFKFQNLCKKTMSGSVLLILRLPMMLSTIGCQLLIPLKVLTFESILEYYIYFSMETVLFSLR